MQELHQVYDVKISSLQEESRMAEERHLREAADYRRKIQECDQKYDELTCEYQALEEIKCLREAQLKALRLQSGTLNSEDDFANKENFDQLEKEFNAFHKFYQVQWNQTKKSIRKKTLTLENLKGQNRQSK